MKHLFLASAANEVADDIAKKIGKKGLKLAFIMTASEVEKGDLWWLRADREALVRTGFKVTDYTFTDKTKVDVVNDLKNMDVIFISGGNTFYLLQQLQQSNSIDVIRKFVEDGKIYIGSSAGSVVAGPNIYAAGCGDDISLAPRLNGYNGLNLVDFVIHPHWGSNSFKEAYTNGFINFAYNENQKNILLTNNQYIEINDSIYKIIDTTSKTNQ